MQFDVQDWAASRRWPVALMTAHTFNANTAFLDFFRLAPPDTEIRFHLHDGIHAWSAAVPDLSLFMRSLFYQADAGKQHYLLSTARSRHLLGVTGLPDACVLLDISPFECRQQEELESEKMKLAVQVSDLGIWDVDSQKGTIYLDARAKSMLGVPLGKQYVSEIEWFGHVHPDDLAELTRSVQRHESGETAQIVTEHRFRHGDGHWIWLSTHGKVIERDAEGGPLRIIGTMRDITVRKKAAEQSNTLLRQIEAVIKTCLASTDGSPALVAATGQQLTARQQEVARLVAQGLSSKDIANKRHVSVGTVLVHRRDLMKSLGLKNTADLTRYVIAQGWL